MAINDTIAQVAASLRLASRVMAERAELWEALADIVTPLDDVESVANILQGLTARDARFAEVTRDLLDGIKQAAR